VTTTALWGASGYAIMWVLSWLGGGGELINLPRIAFRHLIVSSPGQVLGLLKVGAGFLMLILVLSILGGAGVAGAADVGAGLLLTWYLFVNARRLAAEATQSSLANVTVSTSA